MYPPKPPDLDEHGNPVGMGKPPDLDDSGNPTSESSFASQVWNTINKPITTLPTQAADLIAEPLMQYGESESGFLPRMASYGGAFLHNIGEGISGFSSPLNLATLGAFEGAGVLANPGLRATAAGIERNIPLAQKLTTAGRLLSAPVAYEGGKRALDSSLPIDERLGGGLQAVLGGLGMATKTPGINAAEVPHQVSAPDHYVMPAHEVSPEAVMAKTREGFSLSGQDNQGNYIFTPNPIHTPTTPTPTPEPTPNFAQQVLDFNQENPDYQHSLNFDRPMDIPMDDLFGPQNTTTNASGESMASQEAINRQASMKAQGQQYAVYDRAGNMRPLIGPEAVDYNPRPGETYGIMHPEGFQVLNDQGGRFGIKAESSMIPESESIDNPDVYDLSDFANQVIPETNPLSRGAKRPPITNLRPEIPEGQVTNRQMIDLSQSLEVPKNTPESGLTTGHGEVPPGGHEFSEDVLPSDNPLEPNVSSMGMTPEGKMRMDIGDRKAMIEVFKNTYTGHVPVTAGKELLQNAIDATAIEPNGRVGVHVDHDNKALTVTDNGKGLLPEEVGSIYTNLSSSGKRDSGQKTIGEMGVGKTTYLVAGEHVSVSTVARDPASGKLIMTEFEGTPDQIIEGFEPRITEVPEGTSTGTTVTLKVGKGEDMKNLSKYLEHFENYSTSPVPVDVHDVKFENYGTKKTPYSRTINPRQAATTKELVSGETDHSHYRISIPDNAEWGERDQIPLILSNRGMFQGVDSTWTGKNELPDRILVELDPKVKATDPNYPLTAPTRERLKGPVKNRIESEIYQKLVKEANARQAAEIERVYNATQPTGGMPHVMLDEGGKYTPEEFNRANRSYTLSNVHQIMEDVIDSLQSQWATELGTKRIDHNGFVFDDSIRGVNIRNPGDKNAHLVMVNPFAILKSAKNPREAANAFVHVMMHEFTHMLERSEGPSYTARLADVYTRFDTETQNAAKQQLVKVLSGPNKGYSPEIQTLLRDYTESRGRPAVTKDLLLRERKSEYLAATRQEADARYGGSDGEGTFRSFINDERGSVGANIGDTIKVRNPTPQAVKAAVDAGFQFSGEVSDDGSWLFKRGGPVGQAPILESEVGASRPTSANARQQLGQITNEQKASKIQEAYNLSRGIMASGDLSAMFRQGIGLIHKSEFWKSLKPMLESAYSEEAFQANQKAIAERPLFRERTDAQGRKYKSFAEDAGLHLMDLKDKLSGREEYIQSTWAEKYPGVRMSNRAYTAFLNNLRASTFESLVRDGGVFADTTHNLPLSREIAKFVNNATGRGSLGSLESSAKLLGNVFFAPRLIASRLQTLNPHYYVTASPFVRQEALKSLFALASTGMLVTQLGRFGGGSVSNDPSSSDFGKLRIGDTRIDPYAGFQQYVVAANRLINPFGPATGFTPDSPLTRGQMVTSSNTASPDMPGREYNLWDAKRPFDPTPGTVAGRFLLGKLHPVLGFAYGLWNGQKDLGGKPYNLSSIGMDNALIKQFIPLVAQDVYQLIQKDPKMAPIAGMAAFTGMGVQNYSPYQDNPF